MPVTTVTITRGTTKFNHKITLRPKRSESSIGSRKTTRTRKKAVTCDTTAKKVTICIKQDEGEEESPKKVNHVSEYNSSATTSEHYLFELREETITRLYKHMQSNEKLQQIYTLEILSDPYTPTTIKQASSWKDNEIYRRNLQSKKSIISLKESPGTSIKKKRQEKWVTN